MDDRYVYSTMDISNFYGLTPKGLAYYEEQGIVSPKRKKDSTYRLFTLDDCYSLYHSKLYKNAGFSLKQMATMEKEGTVDSIADDLMKSVNDQLKELEIKKRIIERIQEIASILKEYKQNGYYYRIEERPEFERLFVRTFEKEHISDKEHAKEFERWNSFIPIDVASLLYSKEKIESDEKLMNVNIANLMTTLDFRLLGLEKTEQVEHFPSRKCFVTVIKGDSSKIDEKDWLLEPLAFIKGKGYVLNGDILTQMLIVTGKEDQRIRYDLAWIPIE